MLQFLRAITNERANKSKKDYEYLSVNENDNHLRTQWFMSKANRVTSENDYYLHLHYLTDKKKPSSN